MTGNSSEKPAGSNLLRAEQAPVDRGVLFEEHVEDNAQASAWMRAKPRANGSHGDMGRFIARETEHARADATECDAAESLARRRIQAGRIAPGKLVAVPVARPSSRNGANRMNHALRGQVVRTRHLVYLHRIARGSDTRLSKQPPMRRATSTCSAPRAAHRARARRIPHCVDMPCPSTPSPGGSAHSPRNSRPILPKAPAR